MPVRENGLQMMVFPYFPGVPGPRLATGGPLQMFWM